MLHKLELVRGREGRESEGGRGEGKGGREGGDGRKVRELGKGRVNMFPPSLPTLAGQEHIGGIFPGGGMFMVSQSPRLGGFGGRSLGQ